MFLLLLSIYCIKNIVIFYVDFTKNNSFFSFHYTIFHSNVHKHPTCKMNTDEQGRSRSKIKSFE